LRALGVDIGTASVKTALLDSEDGLVDYSAVDISDLNRRPMPSYAERDMAKVWERTVQAIRSLKDLKGAGTVSIDGTSGTIVAIDSDGNPLFQALLYGDKRAQEEADEILKHSDSAKKYQELLPIDASLVLPKILWLRRNFRNFSKVSAILHESDFIMYKMCGVRVTSPNVAGKAHVDVRSKDYLRGIYQDLGVPPSLLPPIREVGCVVGQVSRDASLKTGLPEGITVINGVTDATAGDIATGVLAAGQLNATIGTTLVVHAVVDRISPDKGGRIYYKNFLGSTYIAGGATDAGTLPLDAMGNLLRLSLQDLDALAAGVPAGCDGLLAQPQWTGTRVPSYNPNVRGFFVGLTATNCTPGHFFRSLLEGNAAVLADVIHIIEEVTGESIREIRTCGGGSRSDVGNQIISDAMGIDVLALESSDAAVGSALLAAWGLDSKQSIAQLAAKVVKPRKSYSPRRDLAEIYARQSDRLKRVTKEMYGD
jgi:xylulokinase